MKKLYSILAILFTSVLLIGTANATIVTIQAIGTNSATDKFSPSVANAVCGDTIKWVLVSGTHTTASTTIPTGATSWTSPNITANGYLYVVTVAGTYNYTCHPSSGGHMPGSIVVTCSAGLSGFNNDFISTSYPNPFSDKMVIETPPADMISIYNMVGEKTKIFLLTNGQTKVEIDTGELPVGVYFYSIFKEGIIIETRKLVKN